MATPKEKDTNPFGEGFEEVKAGEFVKWEKVGDKVSGTFVEVEERENRLAGTGVMQKIYTLELEDGTEVRVGSRGKPFDSAMKKIEVGQLVEIVYAQSIPSKTKGNNPFKLIKVGAGKMNDEWLEKNTPNGGDTIDDALEEMAK